MADDPLTDPFGTPNAATNPTGGGLLEQWGAALRDPGVRAGMMQMGLQLMQPMGFGQSPLGHFAESVGAGGEASTRVEQQGLKEQLAQNKIAKDDETISLGRARIGIGQQNANTRAASLAARTTGGGLSAKDLFRAQTQSTRDLEAKAKWEAGQITKQISDSELLGTQLPPELARYKGKSAGDIYREKIADPDWRAKSQIARDTATSASIPPLQNRQIGQVYQTPKGPMVWKGNGWAPATAAPPLEPDVNTEDDL